MMSAFTFSILLALVAILCSLTWLRLKNGPRKLPPGPKGLPIIGNLHMIGELPHRTLETLAKKFGPIMFIKLGSIPTIVVSSPEIAEQFLKTHDIVFANRPTIQSSHLTSYGNKGLGFTPYGPYWRNVRKFCTLELLSSAKIDSLAGMRKEVLGLLVQSLKDAAMSQQMVNFSEKIAKLIEDLTYRMLFGGSKYTEADLRPIIQEIFVLLGTFNIADYVPLLGRFDPQGLTRRIKACSTAVDPILEKIIQEHGKDERKQDTDFVDVMLSLQKKTKNGCHDQLSSTIDREGIKAIVLDIIAGAIDTSYSTIEWTFSELIRHPRVMKKLQQELRNAVGVDRLVEEKDLPKLEYLDMVIKESFRLHPIAPLLLPHESMEDVVVNGYSIPKKSRLIINSWAIGRDPKIWGDNVMEFHPERFVEIKADYRGQDFRFLPFGSGRRSCPGLLLALANVRLSVAQLAHCFDWELPKGMSPCDLDMSEKLGLSTPRAQHLHLVPTCRGSLTS